MNERTLRLPPLHAVIDADLVASRVSPQKLIGAACDFAQELSGWRICRLTGRGK